MVKKSGEMDEAEIASWERRRVKSAYEEAQRAAGKHSYGEIKTAKGSGNDKIEPVDSGTNQGWTPERLNRYLVYADAFMKEGLKDKGKYWDAHMILEDAANVFKTDYAENVWNSGITTEIVKKAYDALVKRVKEVGTRVRKMASGSQGEVSFNLPGLSGITLKPEEWVEGLTKLLNESLERGNQKRERIRTTSLVLMGASIIGALVLLSNNITGNSIAEIGSSASNFGGAIFALLGIVFGKIYFKFRK